MEKQTAFSSVEVKWAVSIFIICSFLAFCGVYKLGLKGLETLSYRATEIAALQHKITVLAGRIGDEESGDYYRRIAVLVDGDASPGAVKTYKAVSKLNGTISNELKELAEARAQLARLTGEECTGGIAASGTAAAASLKVALLAGQKN